MDESTRNTGGWDKDGNRRVAVLYLSEEWVLFAVEQCLGIGPKSEYKLVADGSVIPSGCEVVRVSHAWDRRAFGFLLRHPSFDTVPDGGIPPEVNGDVGVRFKWVPVDPDPIVVGG